MEVEYCRVPPGFRFHPTEEELVGYYLTRKVASQKIDLGVITDIDLYKIEPWDLQERCKLGYDEQNEWYFFSHKDKKYPSGTRTNRATTAGFWKATGRDKAVLSKCKVIGMRKTLVFYEGRAPNGRKSDWIMHEYRLQSSEHGPPQEEGWVVCRAFKKPVPNPRPCYSTYSPFYTGEQDQFAMEHLPDITRPTNPGGNFYEQPFGFGGEHEPKLTCSILDIPRLDSPSMSTTLATTNYECFESGAMIIRNDEISNLQRNDDSRGQFVDWKVLDKLLASQLTESGSSSNLNFPLMNTLDQYDVNDPNQENYFLGSYP